MNTVFVDSNVFLRFLTGDDPQQREKAVALFKRAGAGEVRLLSGPPVLFEIAWTLRTAYGQEREVILEFLTSILRIPGLRITDMPIVVKAIGLAKNLGMDFADAYVAALAGSEGATELATFNRKHFEGVLDLYPLE